MKEKELIMGEIKAVIRNARPEEWERLADIEAECFPPAESATRESIEKRMRLFPENFWVAESEGNILGFINGGTTDKPELPDAFYHEEEKLHVPDGAYQTVFGLNVRPQYRRQGIARQLVMQMIEASRQRRKKGVILTCKEHLIPFYSSCGFVNHGVSDSVHGGAVWYDMKCIF